MAGIKEKIIDRLMLLIMDSYYLLNDTIILLSDGILPAFTTEANKLADIIKPTAITILAILFIVDLLDNMTRKGEEMRWEDVMRSLIKLLICKNLMTIAPYIMSAMYNSTASLIAHVGQVAWMPLDAYDNIKNLLENDFPNDGTGVLNFLKTVMEQLVVYIGYFISSLVVYFLALIVKVMAFGRMFELSILQALSPIPLAFAAWGETKDIAKKYLLNYFAVCLQGLTMMIVFLLFSAGMGTPSNFSEYVVFVIALSVSIFSSGKIARELLGL